MLNEYLKRYGKSMNEAVSQAATQTDVLARLDAWPSGECPDMRMERGRNPVESKWLEHGGSEVMCAIEDRGDGSFGLILPGRKSKRTVPAAITVYKASGRMRTDLHRKYALDAEQSVYISLGQRLLSEASYDCFYGISRFPERS